jgi:hypothetical protein
MQLAAVMRKRAKTLAGIHALVRKEIVLKELVPENYKNLIDEEIKESFGRRTKLAPAG